MDGPVKVVSISGEMKGYLQKKHNTSYVDFYIPNALDPTHAEYAVPECAEYVINKMESEGWVFIQELQSGSALMFRKANDLRNIARELEKEGKI